MELLEVVFEPAAPIGRNRGLVLGKDLKDLARLVLADAGPESDLVGGVGRHQDGQVAVHDPQNQVLPLLSEEFLLPYFFYHRGSVFRMHNGVTFTERHGPSLWESGTNRQGRLLRRVACRALPAQPKTPGQRAQVLVRTRVRSTPEGERLVTAPGALPIRERLGAVEQPPPRGLRARRRRGRAQTRRYGPTPARLSVESRSRRPDERAPSKRV